MGWIQKNFRTIIYVSFLIPILLVALVSISHVTTWYGLSNPSTWAVYLSVGIEVAALSALAAISARMGRKVYVPFGIVTLIQFIGNIFFAYQYIDVNSELFKDWVDLVDPVVSYMGVESGNIIGHKRFLSLFSGGMLPIISMSFLHMLVKFEEEEKSKPEVGNVIDERATTPSNEDVYRPSEEELMALEEYLKRINEVKFGKLQEVDEEPLTEDKSSEEDSSDIVTQNETEIIIFSDEAINNNISENEEIVQNQIVETNDTEIEVEPDFYAEEKPDYVIDENPSENNPRRLNYLRSH